MRLPVLIIILSLLAPLKPAHPQEKPTCDDQQQLNERRIEILEAEVQALRTELDELKKKLPARRVRPKGLQPPPSTATDTDAPKQKNDYSAIVRKLDPGCDATDTCRYLLERKGLNEALEDLDTLGRQARVIPNYDRDSGTYKGFKLIGVRPNSLYRAIGIRSGDIIYKVNGQELSSPSKALELFTQVQTSTLVAIQIIRRGKNRLHIIHVVDDITKPAPPLPKDLNKAFPAPPQ